jgi:RNA-binding protein
MTGSERERARAVGQRLDATVFVGKGGVTDAAAAELAGQLKSHPLVKVRISRDAPGERREMAEQLAAKAGGELVEVRGYTAVVAKRRQRDRA